MKPPKKPQDEKHQRSQQKKFATVAVKTLRSDPKK